MPLRRLWRRPRSELQVFLLAFVIYAYFMPQWADWNIDSRIALVHAIVDDHSLRIDNFHWITWDKAVYKGHFYSDKAPGTAFLGAVVYAGYSAARDAPVTGGVISAIRSNSAWNTAIRLGKADTQLQPAAKGRNLGGCQRTGVAGNVQVIPWGNRLIQPIRDGALSKYIVSVGTVSLISSAFLAFFFWFLGLFIAALWIRWLAVGLYGFGTVALPYSSNFYSHQLVAAFLFTAFALLYLVRIGRAGRWGAISAGFLLGASFFTEYTIALVIAILGLYALAVLRSSPLRLLGFCGAAAIPVLGLFAYNALSFGGPLDTGYTHDFCWSAAQAGGFAGFTYPKGGALWDLTFGPYRGLFFMSPFLLLAAPGAWFMSRRGYFLEAIVTISTACLFILVLSAYWGWNGGRVDGPRYLVPIVPFLAFPAAFFLDSATRSNWARVVVAVLGVWSLGVTWTLFLAGDVFPTSWLRNPLTQYSLPLLSGNHVTSNLGFFLGLAGWQSLLPLLVLVSLVGGWGVRGHRANRPERVMVREPDDGLVANGSGAGA